MCGFDLVQDRIQSRGSMAFHQPLDECFQQGDGPGFCTLIFKDMRHRQDLVRDDNDTEMMELHGIIMSFQVSYIDTQDEEEKVGMWRTNIAFRERYHSIKNSQIDPGLTDAKKNFDETPQLTMPG